MAVLAAGWHPKWGRQGSRPWICTGTGRAACQSARVRRIRRVRAARPRTTCHSMPSSRYPSLRDTASEAHCPRTPRARRAVPGALRRPDAARRPASASRALAPGSGGRAMTRCSPRSRGRQRPGCRPPRPPRITASSSIQSEGFQELQQDQWYCIVARARSSGDASVQATMNGCTSRSCTPRAVSSASAPRSSRLGQRNSSAGVCSQRSAIGHREDTMPAIVHRPARFGTSIMRAVHRHRYAAEQAMSPPDGLWAAAVRVKDCRGGVCCRRVRVMAARADC